jgi:hypothetical protein
MFFALLHDQQVVSVFVKFDEQGPARADPQIQLIAPASTNRPHPTTVHGSANQLVTQNVTLLPGLASDTELGPQLRPGRPC